MTRQAAVTPGPYGPSQLLEMLRKGCASKVCPDSDAGRRDGGSAVIEFCFMTVALLLPLLYVAHSVAIVVEARQAALVAVREAGRAYVLSASPREGAARARGVAKLALADRGVTLPTSALALACVGGPCLSPDTTVRTSLRMSVRLPLPPGAPAVSVTVNASHVTPVDRFRSVS